MINFLLACLLAILHITAGQLKFITDIPRSIWLSIAGGISIAYVFLHLLPALSEHHQDWDGGIVFLLALAGLVVFYGLEKYAKVQGGHTDGAASTFWIHIGSFAVYNFIIGYVIIVEFQQRELYLFVLAMAFHFLVNDFGLRHHHPKAYDHIGKWMVSAAIVLGASLGLMTEINQKIIVSGTSFIGGSVIMNALKEELPDERKSKYWAFVLGVVLYASLILYLDHTDA